MRPFVLASICLVQTSQSSSCRLMFIFSILRACLSIWYSKQKNVTPSFSTFSNSEVAKYWGKICQKFWEWGLFEKMSNLSHFRRQFVIFAPLTRSRRWSLQGPPYFQFSTTCNHILKSTFAFHIFVIGSQQTRLIIW